jgi:hypothetical protein
MTSPVMDAQIPMNRLMFPVHRNKPFIRNSYINVINSITKVPGRLYMITFSF